MTKKRMAPAELSPAQRGIMEIVWQRGEVSVSDVHDVMSAKREVSRNTVRTLIERMEQKGWLKHRELRRVFLYSAAVPRKTSIARRALDLLNSFCGGSPELLFVALLDHRGLTEDELKRIEALIASAREESTKEGQP